MSLGAAVGDTTAPTSVTVVSSATTSLQAVTTSAAQSYTAATSTTLNGTLAVNTAGAGVSFTGPVLLAAGGGAITLTGSNAANNVTFSATSTVNGAQPLSITAAGGAVSFGAAVGGTTAPDLGDGGLQRHHQPAGGDHHRCAELHGGRPPPR